MGEHRQRHGAGFGRRYLVSGRVQGVGFRAAACRRARELDLEGYARNLADGRVEVVARGAPTAVATLQAWLHQGPDAARVVRVEDAGEADCNHAGFIAL